MNIECHNIIDNQMSVFSVLNQEEKELLENNLSEEELAGLGAYVVARLIASKAHPY